MSREEEEEDYFLPLEDQRVFGAGIRKKRVPFVRSSDLTTTTTASSISTPGSSPGPSIANKYLSIVLPQNQKPSGPASPKIHSAPPSPAPSTLPPTTHERCEVCNLPIDTQPKSQPGGAHPNPNPNQKPHESSLAHQVCLTHSHPPSHLDRTRPGLRYLSAYGWDPDSRRGLGAVGREGILEPVKGRLKLDTVGLGVENKDTDRGGRGEREKGKGKVHKLNAKQVRKGAAENRRREERLREVFFGRDDVVRYLGEGI